MKATVFGRGGAFGGGSVDFFSFDVCPSGCKHGVAAGRRVDAAAHFEKVLLLDARSDAGKEAACV